MSLLLLFTMLEGIHCLSLVFLMVMIPAVIITVQSYEDLSEKDKLGTEKLLKLLGVGIIICISLLLIPSSDRLVKTRVNIVKLELMKDENLHKGSEALERILKKLEDKYLKEENNE